MISETELNRLSTRELRDRRDAISEPAELERINRELHERWVELTPRKIVSRVTKSDGEEVAVSMPFSPTPGVL